MNKDFTHPPTKRDETQLVALGHEIRRELRPATCCDRHSNWWFICSCGYEVNVDGHPAGWWGVITDHRLDLLTDDRAGRGGGE